MQQYAAVASNPTIKAEAAPWPRAGNRRNCGDKEARENSTGTCMDQGKGEDSWRAPFLFLSHF